MRAKTKLQEVKRLIETRENHLIFEQSVKRSGEGDDQKKKDDEKPSERSQNVPQHHHVNTQMRKLSNVQN